VEDRELPQGVIASTAAPKYDFSGTFSAAFSFVMSISSARRSCRPARTLLSVQAEVESRRSGRYLGPVLACLVML
jgi:hypothetical protein